MSVRYDRLFWTLVIILVLGGYAFLRDSVRQIIADLVTGMHHVTNSVAFEPKDDVGKVALLCVFLITLVAVIKLMTRNRGDQDPSQ